MRVGQVMAHPFKVDLNKKEEKYRSKSNKEFT